MTSALAEIIINCLIVASAVLAVIFTIGIVWRVEKELDTSYKLFAISIISFTINEVLSIFQFEGRIFVSMAILAFKLIFAICFLAGIIIMRDILRQMDGEKAEPILDSPEHNRPI
jgi:hypothetical protein